VPVQAVPKTQAATKVAAVVLVERIRVSPPYK